MEWITFLSGTLSASFAYALFAGARNADDDFEVIDAPGRRVILHCGTCRKQKHHREIEQNLYECERCGRHVDLRIGGY